MIDKLSLNLVVFLPDVSYNIKLYFPEMAERYETFHHLMLGKRVNLSNLVLRYMLLDDNYYIPRRIGNDNY